MEKTIYLVGFMGAGKTYIGKQVAVKLNIPFYDLDSIIEKKLNMSVEEIFEKRGETYFRKLESELLLNEKFTGIIACGGGVIERKINREFLKTKTAIWLNPSWNIIFKRIKDSDRPLVKRLGYKKLKELYYRREKYYKEVADFVIEKDFLSKVETIIKFYFFNL